MRFEMWKTPNGRWHFQMVKDDGKPEPVQSFDRIQLCSNALARQRKLHPEAEIVRVEKPTRGT